MDKVEIYYFSGTGNSLFIAKELQKRLPNSNLIPIVSLMDQKTIKAKGKIVGLIFPVHALTIPVVVKKFIDKTDFKSSEYIFAIATRFGTIFRGFEKIDRLLNKKGKHLSSHFIINMGNNEARHESYVVPTETEILFLEKAALKKLDFIQNVIKDKRVNKEIDTDDTLYFRHHSIVNYLLEKTVLLGMDVSEYIGGVNYFYVDSKCSGCGVCEKVCLSGKIKLTDKKPVWQRKVFCYMCFACLNFCPKNAIQIEDILGVKSYSKKNGRYPHPYATINDIAEQKIRGTNENS